MGVPALSGELKSALQAGDYDRVPRWLRALRHAGKPPVEPLGMSLDSRTVGRIRQAAEHGKAGAQMALGYMFVSGEGVAQDKKEAVKWYRKAADQGLAEAQLILAGLCAAGWGVPENMAEAVTWYRKAAEQGDVDAQYELGFIYDLGLSDVASDKAEAFKWYHKAADQGNAEAEGHLATMYGLGEGVARDDAESLKWDRKAAESGNVVARLSLVRRYRHSYGDDQDKAEGLKWLRMAALQGDVGAQFELGLAYALGDGVAQDDAEASKWWRQATEHWIGNGQPKGGAADWFRGAAEKPGDEDSAYFLGLMYANGVGVVEDSAEAAKWWRKALDGPAQFNLGLMYELGWGVAQDDSEASRCFRLARFEGYSAKDDACSVKWYHKAAERGSGEMQFRLGREYQFGIDIVAHDSGEAAKWYRKAADQGYAPAQLRLGLMYETGWGGVRRDMAVAVMWYRKAAEQGNAEAQACLAGMYSAGEGLPQDKAEAVRWYCKAAEQGYADAQLRLGLMYCSGDVVGQDLAEAAKWFRKAAEQGNATAQFNLGLAYSKGLGVAQDNAEAVQWWRRAAEQGVADAQFNLAVAYHNGTGVLKSPSAALEGYAAAANTYLAQESREPALVCYDRMKGIDPQNPLTRALYGKLYTERGPGAAGGQTTSVAGTGWSVAGGFVVTCYHVVRGTSKVTLRRSDGTQTSASLVLQDAANDLALLCPADAAFLPAALPLAPAGPRVGQSVFAVGYPHPDIMGTSPKTTDGIVNSALGFGDDPRTFQISAALQAGNSGGPVFDMSGQVVGIALAKLNAVEVFKWSGDLPENVGYAVKVPYLQSLLSAGPQDGAKIEVLKPLPGATLDQVAAHVQGSVLLVIAEQ